MIDHLDAFRPGRKHSPEQALFRAVVAQAVLDFLATPKNGSHDPDLARLSAFHWLTAESGEDAEARAYVCALAGVDPDALRQQVIRVLEGRAFDPSQSGSADHLARLEDARALWRAHRDRPTISSRIRAGAGKTDAVGHDGPFAINSLGALFHRGDDLPAGRWRGGFIPSLRTSPGKVLYALTRPRGCNLRMLRQAHAKDWEGIAAALAEKFALDLVWLRKGEPSSEADPDAKAYLFPRPIETSIAA